MKKIFLAAIFLFIQSLLASDAITLDSIFQNQKGLRSITSLRTLSSDNSYAFDIYPNVSINNEGRFWRDVKILSLQQTFLYDFTQNFDALIAINGSKKRREYFSIPDLYAHDDSTDLDSVWVGGTYAFDTIGLFKPYLTLQVAALKKNRYLGVSKNSSLKSFSAKASFRNFSDPVISSIYFGSTINLDETIGGYKINNGNTFSAGFDFSIILNPKFSLELGFAQIYQTKTKINNKRGSETSMISNVDIGATYSLSTKTSLSVSGSIGGTSKSPDSSLTISLWQKF
ncbi:hypothetical protein [Campylobacter sp. RM16188]|uniref:hypothetical protein n=1 Tax=Campylobacter sp. RM16188 TaxID=1705725 RepID=UPI001555368B|nr:hypothetical protein [Campylobacter sp. RM16188]